MTTPWYSVSSSNVAAVRQVDDDLEIRFLPSRTQPSRTWRYPGAGIELEDFLRASSKGKYVWYVIRPSYGDGYEV